MKLIAMLLCGCLLGLSLLAGEGNGEAEEKPAPPKPAAGANKFGPKDIEVQLKDGSTLRGELVGIETLKLKTPYGVLSIPAGEMQRLKFGSGGAGSVDAKSIAAAIKDLTSDTKTSWPNAERTLERSGSDAVEPLFDARPKAGAEARARIDGVLKRVLGREKVNAAAGGDAVRAAKFDGNGQIELSSFRLKTKLGDLPINAEDVDSIRWLASGNNITMEMEAISSLRNWQETGITVHAGEPLGFQCDGTINMFNTVVPPSGAQGWSSRPFPAGAVIGKIGEAGEPFLISKGKHLDAPADGQLYLRIFLTEETLQRDEINQASGSYQIQIASGARADEIKE